MNCCLVIQYFLVLLISFFDGMAHYFDMQKKVMLQITANYLNFVLCQSECWILILFSLEKPFVIKEIDIL